jgi:hypothetical protein
LRGSFRCLVARAAGNVFTQRWKGALRETHQIPKIGTLFLFYTETVVMPRKKKEIQPDSADSPYTFSDEATKRKIKKHLTDIRDVITEEDIANVKVPGEEDSPLSPPADEEAPKKETKDEKAKLDREDDPITPWDVID